MDDPGQPVDHGVADGDEAVDPACRKTGDEDLEREAHVRAIVSNAVDPRELHQDAVVVDAHNDLPVLLLLRNRELGDQGFGRYWSEHWVPEARAGGVDVQVLPIYVAPEVAEASLRSTLLQLEALEREAAQTPEVALCRTGAEIDAALADGRIALLVALEGTPGIGADVELFSVFHRLGVRMVSFTHWSRALLAEGSADEETGSRLPAGRRARRRRARASRHPARRLAPRRRVGRPRARARDAESSSRRTPARARCATTIAT